MISALILTHALIAPAAIQEDPFAQYKVNLVPVGQKVPNFTVMDSQGNKFDLYTALKGSKVTLINFWFAH